MYGTITRLTDQHLLLELERVEDAIARSATFTRWVDGAGGTRLSIGEHLLALAEREHAIVQELRRRRRSASTALPATAAWSAAARQTPIGEQHNPRRSDMTVKDSFAYDRSLNGNHTPACALPTRGGICDCWPPTPESAPSAQPGRSTTQETQRGHHERSR